MGGVCSSGAPVDSRPQPAVTSEHTVEEAAPVQQDQLRTEMAASTYIGPNEPGFEAHLERTLDKWCQIFWGHTDWQEIRGGQGQVEGSLERRKNYHFTMSRAWFKAWDAKCGNGAGLFLKEPISDSTGIEDRGVAKEWLAAVWYQMQELYCWLTPTRVMIDSFFMYLTREHKCPVYFLVPLHFRKKPDAFISHAWDTAAHCLFKAAAEKQGTSFWLDAFAVNQWTVGADVSFFATIVKNIGNTILIIRGQGSPAENLRVMYRSWCIFEIMHTPNNCLHASITAQNGDHKQYARAINEVDISKAESVREEDKRSIDRLVLARYGNWDAANRVVKRVLKKEYYKFFCGGHGFNGDKEKGERFGAAHYGRNHD